MIVSDCLIIWLSVCSQQHHPPGQCYRGRTMYHRIKQDQTRYPLHPWIMWIFNQLILVCFSVIRIDYSQTYADHRHLKLLKSSSKRQLLHCLLMLLKSFRIYIILISKHSAEQCPHQGDKWKGWYSSMLFFNILIKESNQIKVPKFTIILYIVK